MSGDLKLLIVSRSVRDDMPFRKHLILEQLQKPHSDKRTYQDLGVQLPKLRPIGSNL
jgi:hypothetical protein